VFIFSVMFKNEEMVLNDAGNMVAKTLSELSNHFEGVKIPEYVVMPNHVHFIVYLPGNIQLKTVVSEFKSYYWCPLKYSFGILFSF